MNFWFEMNFLIKNRFLVQNEIWSDFFLFQQNFGPKKNKFWTQTNVGSEKDFGSEKKLLDKISKVSLLRLGQLSLVRSVELG